MSLYHTDKTINFSEIATYLSQKEYEALLKKRRMVLRQMATLFILENIGGQSEVDQKKVIDLCTKALVLSDVFNGGLPEDILQKLKPYMMDLAVLSKAVDQLNTDMQIYKQELYQKRRAGIFLQKAHAPAYPDLLKESRLFVKIEPIIPLAQQLSQVIDEINAALPESKQLHLQINSLTKHTVFQLEDNSGQVQRLGRFLNKISMDMQKLIDNLNDSVWTDSVKSQFEQMMKNEPNMFMRQYISGKLTTINIIKDFNQKKKTNVPLSETLFYIIKRLLVNDIKMDSIAQNIQEQCNIIQATQTALTFQQVNNSSGILNEEAPIDLLIFSRVPADITCMAAYTDFDSMSCMCPTEMQAIRIQNDIALGTIIVYGVNSQNPHKRLSRILLKPRKGQYDDDMIYNISRIYGRKDYMFAQIVTDFTQKHFDRGGRSTIFKLLPQFYQDNDPALVYRGASLTELCEQKNLVYRQTNQDMFIYGSLETSDLSPEMKINYDSLYVSQLEVSGKLPTKMPYAHQVTIDAQTQLRGILDLSRCKTLIFREGCDLSRVRRIIVSEKTFVRGAINFPPENIVRRKNNKNKFNKVPKIGARPKKVVAGSISLCSDNQNQR